MARPTIQVESLSLDEIAALEDRLRCERERKLEVARQLEELTAREAEMRKTQKELQQQLEDHNMELSDIRKNLDNLQSSYVSFTLLSLRVSSQRMLTMTVLRRCTTGDKEPGIQYTHKRSTAVTRTIRISRRSPGAARRFHYRKHRDSRQHCWHRLHSRNHCHIARRLEVGSSCYAVDRRLLEIRLMSFEYDNQRHCK